MEQTVPGALHLELVDPGLSSESLLQSENVDRCKHHGAVPPLAASKRTFRGLGDECCIAETSSK